MKIHTKAEVAKQPQALEWVKASDAKRLEHERDELAAHVERLQKAGKAIRHELAQWALTEKDPETSAAMCQFDQVARETPTTSLAHRDLIKQAEALESLAAYCAGNRDVYERCMARAIDLRQQANQLENQQ